MVCTEEGEKLQGLVKRTLQIGRAAGLRCCAFTQRPTVTNISGDVKALFPDRVALRCATALESRVILDQDGAEALEDVPGQGIFLSAAKYRKIQVMKYDSSIRST
jgi:DNA segregation ATPase FtsK/SpoIIIE-like protein